MTDRQSPAHPASAESLAALEERIAHLTRTVEDLSDVVAEQARQIARQDRRLALLLEREAEREFDTGQSIPLADQKPPHY